MEVREGDLFIRSIVKVSRIQKKPAMPRQTSPDVYMAYADGPAMPSSICLLISAYLQRAAEQMIGQHPQIFETSHWRI